MNNVVAAVWRWIDRNIFDLAREVRWSYLPPLMVYLAAGISTLTSVVGTFFVKDYLNLSASFLAALAFWAVIPWSLKMVLGHLVDLLWRWKGWMVIVGAVLIALSLLIMAALIDNREAMAAIMPVEAWYVLSVLLAPIGFVVQDAVADAMTVEAVPRVDEHGRAIDAERGKLMHTTMQTLGRVAIIGGSLLVSLVNLYIFADVQDLHADQKALVYRNIYLMALAIPVISVLGVAIAAVIRLQARRRLLGQGMSMEQAHRLLSQQDDRPAPNWWILGGSAIFVAFTLATGFSDLRYGQEIVFIGSMAIVIFLIARLTRELDVDARATLLGTALVIFVFRAVPTPGPGVTWWMIDELKFDEKFLSVLGLTAGVLTLAGMFVFRRFMAQRSITYVVGALTLCGAVLALPILGMYYGLHRWTAALTGGIVDAQFIALVDTALESPLGQIAMIPMLAWIARSAPANLKATYFAVMGSFTNLALSLGQLGTKYLNQIFIVTREVRDPAAGGILVTADYSQLGALLIVTLVIGLAAPFAAIAFVRLSKFKSA